MPILDRTCAEPPSLPIPDDELPFWKGLRAMLDNPMEGWPRAVFEANAYRPRNDLFRRLYISDPDALHAIFLERIEDFPKAPLAQRLLRPMLGDGLVTADLDAWRPQRRTAAPPFQAHGIDQSTPAIAAIAEDTIARWLHDGPGERDMCAEMMRITFDIILETMLGGRGRADAAEMGRQFNIYLRTLGRPSIADLLGAPAWMRTALSSDGGYSVRYMRRSVATMIAARRTSAPRGDLVDLLLNARDGAGEPMPMRMLEDNILTFLAAGHETTALALTWSLYLVSQYPEAARKIRDEIQTVAGDAPLNAEQANALIYTKQVIYEAMRLYPPVPVLSRYAAKDCTLAGVDVRAGDAVVIPIYALHRHRVYWDKPDAFDPDRFAPGKHAERRRYIYMPFGAGRRICLGAAFAMSEAAIVLATLLRAMTFTLRPNHPIRPLLRITMRPENGLPMQVAPRRRSKPAPVPEVERALRAFAG